MAEASMVEVAVRRKKVEKPSEIIRKHSVDMFNILSSSKETLLSLTVKLYQRKLIDRHTKTILSSPSTSPQQASIALLDYLELKIEQSVRYFSDLLNVLRTEEIMKDLVEKFEAEIMPPQPLQPLGDSK